MLGTFNGECHLGWETNGDYCYYAFKSSASFVYNEARSSCLAENATLTSVENREEQLFLNGKYLFCQNHYSLNVNEWKFHSPIEWNSCKPLKKEWFCTLNSKFPLIKSENHSKKSELPLIWGVKRRTTRKRIVLRLTPQTSGNSLFLESFSLYMKSIFMIWT